MPQPWEKPQQSHGNPWDKPSAEEAPPPVPKAPMPAGMTTSSPNYAGMALGAGEAVKDIGKGLGESAVSLMSTGNHAVRKIPGIGEFLTTPITGTPADEAIAHTDQMATPANTTQAISKGVGDAAQFLIPGGAEEAGAAKLATMAPRLGRAAKPLARMATAALSSGAVNAAQGGSPVTGALAGAGGAGVGMALKAAAPTLTGIAQGLKPQDYAKTGGAILDETSGIFPGQIRTSARGVLKELNPQLNAAAENSTAMVPMASAREAANDQLGSAMGQNNPKMTKGIKRMANQLFEQTHEPVLGAAGPSATLPIPEEIPASQYLNLKRGIGKALPAGSWSPESSNAFKGPRNAIYGKMNNAFEGAVPEAAPLNRRISALIPATEKPKNFFFGHALGPGVGATLGGVGGWRRDGIPGAIQGAAEGGLAGMAIPAAMNTAARAAYSPAAMSIMRPLVTGAALQEDRKKKEQ